MEDLVSAKPEPVAKAPKLEPALDAAAAPPEQIAAATKIATIHRGNKGRASMGKLPHGFPPGHPRRNWSNLTKYTHVSLASVTLEQKRVVAATKIAAAHRGKIARRAVLDAKLGAAAAARVAVSASPSKEAEAAAAARVAAKVAAAHAVKASEAAALAKKEAALKEAKDTTLLQRVLNDVIGPIISCGACARSRRVVVQPWEL